MKHMTRVLVVDDSPIMRDLITDILEEAPDISVVGKASDPFVARDLIKKLRPDVLTLDVEMPKMDGLDFLEKIMRLHPMPVVMISGLTKANSETALEALALGAVDVIAKSKINVDMSIAEKSSEIIEKVREAANANFSANYKLYEKNGSGASSFEPSSEYDPTSKIVAIGASAGGVDAIQQILLSFPEGCPGTVITQHMPGTFTEKFSKRLNSLTHLIVKEASHNEIIKVGHVYISPGERHLEVGRSSRLGYVCKLSDGPPISGHRPSIDILFDSMAKSAGEDGIGVILTGMGKDGSKGLLAMRQAGAITLGQDEASSLVYGMPKVAFDVGAVSRQVSLKRMAKKILSHCVASKGSNKKPGTGS